MLVSVIVSVSFRCMLMSFRGGPIWVSVAYAANLQQAQMGLITNEPVSSGQGNRTRGP